MKYLLSEEEYADLQRRAADNDELRKELRAEIRDEVVKGIQDRITEHSLPYFKQIFSCLPPGCGVVEPGTQRAVQGVLRTWQEFLDKIFPK